MRSVSLASLKSSILSRADMEHIAGASEFIDTTTGGELDQMINLSACMLYDIVLSEWGLDYYWNESTLTTTAGQAYIDLPADFYKLLKIGWVESSTSIVKLRPFEIDEEWLIDSGAWDQNTPPRYKLRGNDRVYLSPVPSSVISLRVQYTPVFPGVDSTHPLQGINGWERYIIVDVARMLRIKEESETGPLDAELGMLRQHIKEMAKHRDLLHGPEMRLNTRVLPSRRWP